MEVAECDIVAPEQIPSQAAPADLCDQLCAYRQKIVVIVDGHVVVVHADRYLSDWEVLRYFIGDVRDAYHAMRRAIDIDPAVVTHLGAAAGSY